MKCRGACGGAGILLLLPLALLASSGARPPHRDRFAASPAASLVVPAVAELDVAAVAAVEEAAVAVAVLTDDDDDDANWKGFSGTVTAGA